MEIQSTDKPLNNWCAEPGEPQQLHSLLSDAKTEPTERCGLPNLHMAQMRRSFRLPWGWLSWRAKGIYTTFLPRCRPDLGGEMLPVLNSLKTKYARLKASTALTYESSRESSTRHDDVCVSRSIESNRSSSIDLLNCGMYWPLFTEFYRLSAVSAFSGCSHMY